MNRVLYVSKSRLENTLNEYHSIVASVATWKDRMETQNSNIAEANEGDSTVTYTEKTTAYNEGDFTDFIFRVNKMEDTLLETLTKTKGLIARSEDFENILKGENAETSEIYANVSTIGDVASYYDDFCSHVGYTGAIKDNTEIISDLGDKEEENLTNIESELKSLKTITVSIEGQASHIRDCIKKQNYTNPLYDSLKKYCKEVAIMHDLLKYVRDTYFQALDGPREHNRSYSYNGAPTNDKENIYISRIKELGYSEEDIGVLKRYTGLTAEQLYNQLKHMPASEIANMIKLAYAKCENENSDVYEDIVQYYIQTLNLTDQQLEWIKNLENAQGYKCSVVDLQIVAASLFAVGMEPAFVAGMLGNMCHEGNVGHLENVNAGTNTGREYWDNINACSVDYNGKIYTYKQDFADKHLYEVDYQAYKKLIQQDMDDHSDYNVVIGCGCVQWTHRGRFVRLMGYYDIADQNGDKNGQLSYEECLMAETQFMAYELTNDYPDDNGNFYNYYTNVTKAWEDAWVNDGKEANSRNSASDAAKRICDVYENPNPNDSHIDERMSDAEDLYDIMMGA